MAANRRRCPYFVCFRKYVIQFYKQTMGTFRMANLECMDELQDILGKGELFAVARSIFPINTDINAILRQLLR